MIEVKDLTKEFGPVRAIDGVTFAVEKGEILGFLGPNAAGKTTTMRILSCFFPPTRGQAKVAGYDLLESSLEVRKRIGYMPENIPLYPEMSVDSYLHFVGESKGLSFQERKNGVARVQDLCGIGEVMGSTIGKLSRGYRQRVGLAQALLNDPPILILDEPTVGLDPKQIIEIRNLIKGFQGKKTVILSTHILPEVHMTCQRVVIINEGKVIASDTPENLMAQLQGAHRTIIELEGPSQAILESITTLPGVKNVTRSGTNGPELSPGQSRETYLVECQVGRDPRKELAQMAVTRGWGLLSLRLHEVSLEDVFVRLVTKEEG